MVMETQLRNRIIDIYRKRAKNYDYTANLYYLFGYREWAYRRMAVDALHLKLGDTVIELACGTGLNFPLYQAAVGPQGRIIGVDLTDAMLAEAQARVQQNKWHNVTLVHSDALLYQFPKNVNALISTYALSLIPELDQVLMNAAEALEPGGRLALLELQVPDPWPNWLVNLAVYLMRPFAVTDEWLARRPWKTIREKMGELFTDLSETEKYLGLTYIIAGEKPDKSRQS